MEILCYNSKCKTDSINTVHFKQGFPKALFYPQNVLHLPPPRVNSDNVVTSSVNINAEHYRWLLFLIS